MSSPMSYACDSNNGVLKLSLPAAKECEILLMMRQCTSSFQIWVVHRPLVKVPMHLVVLKPRAKTWKLRSLCIVAGGSGGQLGETSCGKQSSCLGLESGKFSVTECHRSLCGRSHWSCTLQLRHLNWCILDPYWELCTCGRAMEWNIYIYVYIYF